MRKFKVTQLFTSGLLAGLTYTWTTTIEYKVGWECLKPCGGDPYKIIEVVEL